jgi:transcriptional regulator with XRE-family HTH domain
MRNSEQNIDQQIASRLKNLRQEQGWSLDELAAKSGISRATLSRLENAEVSGTASVLGKLCGAYGMPMSRLMHMVEEEFAPLVRQENQPVWHDITAGFERRSVSPPAHTLSGEVIECHLKPGTRIKYEVPPRPGLEHHLVMQTGSLAVTLENGTFELNPGDCLRYKIYGASAFTASAADGAHYFIFIV